MYESTSLKSRWQEYSPIFISQTMLIVLIVADYALTSNLNHRLGSLFYLLIGITFVLISLPLFKFYMYFKQRYLILILHYLAVGTFLIFFAPIDGAYYFLLFFYITVSMYWYSWRGYVAGLLFSAVVTALAVMVQFGNIDANIIYHITSHFAILFVSSLYTALILLRQPIAADALFLRKSASFERGRLISLINSMADAVIATDSTGIVTLYNGAALSLLNTNQTIETLPLYDFFVLKDEKNQPVDILKLARKNNKTITRNDLHFESSDKTSISIMLSISPIRSVEKQNAEEGFILLARDITKEKSLDDERNEFIAVVSHELRTPIAVVEANISTALHTKGAQSIDEQTKKLLNQAHDKIVFLSGMVNDLATLNRADRNDLNISVKLLNPTEIINQVIIDYAAEAQKAELELKIGETVETNSILSSELYIKEILQNFVTNAIKYTKHGSITLSVGEGANGSVIFSVADTGIGIPASDKPKIFSKFYRSEDYRTRQTSGTGLGLYITKKLARRIKSKVWFESKLNVGSTFYLEVPSVGALSQDQKKVTQEEIKDFASSV